MKILFGATGVVVSGRNKAPSAFELCAIDKRFIYIGTVIDSQGNFVHDAFIHVLDPTEIYTIKETIEIKENTFLLNTERHFFDDKSPVLDYFYYNHDKEIYVGDICDGSGKTGEVWHNAYKTALRSNTLYTKTEDGTHILVNPPCENCFSVPDRYGFRIVVKSPDQPEQHYAFFLGMTAFIRWVNLKNNASEDQEVLHSLDPDYTKFLYPEERMNFEKYPQLVKAYPKSYSRKGYLNVKE